MCNMFNTSFLYVLRCACGVYYSLCVYSIIKNKKNIQIITPTCFIHFNIRQGMQYGTSIHIYFQGCRQITKKI